MNKRRRLNAAATLLFLSVLVSCTQMDYQVGDGLIPGDQQMKVGMDTIYGIDTYLARYDSFPASGYAYGYAGSAVSETFGRTSASFSTQYMLYYFSSGDEMFGTAPVYDSMVFTFTLGSNYYGDTTKTQRFNIYELDGDLSIDSTYYTDFDQQSVASDRLLYSFELTGLPTTELRFRMTGDAADEFARKLMDTTGRTYTGDSAFYARHKGFYIVPDESSPEDAAVYQFSYSNMELELYTRNHTDETAQTVKDTVVTYYSFSNANSLLFYNASVSTILHDYEGTQIRNLNDTLPGDEPAPVGYIQGLGGVVTYVRFSDEFIDKLLSEIKEPYKSMVINKATLVWSIKDPSPSVYEAAFGRIGAYANYKTFVSIPDYNYTAETNNDLTLLYDGYLDRTHGDYSIDVSSFLQKIVNQAKYGSPKDAPHTMILGPSSTELASFGEVVLETGASDPPLRVELTYTLVR